MSLKQRYRETIQPKLLKELDLSNIHEVPKVVKVTVNRGLGEAAQNAKALEASIEELATITGSSTMNFGRQASNASATALMTRAFASMPILTAPIRKSSKLASICARRKWTGGTCTAVTPRVFCAVTAVTAVIA